MQEETKNKIKYIGKWAIRIFLIALISNCLKSCANAMSYSEAFEICKDYCGQAGLFASASYDRSEFEITYDNFLDYLDEESSTYMYVWKNTTNTSNTMFYIYYYDYMSIDGNNYTARVNQTRYNTTKMSYSWNNCYNIHGSTNPSGQDSTGTFPKGNNTFYMVFDGNSIIKASFIPPPTVEYLEYRNEFDGKYYQNFMYYTFQGDLYQQNKLKIGEIIQNDAYYAEIKLRQGANIDNIIIGESFITFPNNIYNDGVLTYENGSLYVNTINLKYSQPYRLEIESYYGDGGDNLYEDIDWYLFLPVNATITGDNIISLGSGDFTNQDTASQIIQNQEQQNNWWKKTVNDMFVVSGEAIQKMIDDTMRELQMESGEIAEATRILEYLDSEPGDFIISWGNLTTHFSISGEQIPKQLVIPSKVINFSEMERDSEELHEAMGWARIITNISIFSILIHQMYICFIATLGVPTYLYGMQQEEKAQLAKQEEAKKQAQARQEANWRSALDRQKYNEWLYNHRKR